MPSFPQALYTSTPRQEENLIEDETRETNLYRTDDPVDTSIEIKMPADEGGILSLPENTAENSAEQNKTNAIDSETMVCTYITPLAICESTFIHQLCIVDL